MVQSLRNEKHTGHEIILGSDSEEAISSESQSEHEEDSATMGCNNNVSGN